MRLIIVSNRAPVSIVADANGNTTYKKSSGGLASGLSAYVAKLKKSSPAMEVVWIGWPGNSVDDEETAAAEILEKFGVQSVFLSEQVMENFYEGFCNKTIWPLFHYFPVLTSYNKEYWDEYVFVNKLFSKVILKFYRPGDVLWIHDYHLMLLPALLRNKLPDASIGFFLHIPFPSYEVFRLLPREWRKKILEGLFGADLIGFHTFDYRTYFLRSTLNILGLTENMGEVMYGNRLVKIDSFPMGIDYDKYHSASNTVSLEKEKQKIRKSISTPKIILSIDRQDYTKGILNRLKAYEHFLQTTPQWIKQVTLILVVVPSRIGVESYQSIKSNIDELVGHINGTYGTLDWQPIHYQYRSLSHNELLALYNLSDVALITPLRDGMNLIAKEFIACRTNSDGVLILSEMTGAAQELTESVIINPNNIEEISDSLTIALEMTEEEQEKRMSVMQRRVKLYDVFKWADNFLSDISTVKLKQESMGTRALNSHVTQHIIQKFEGNAPCMIFLDYDGTLVEHADQPEKTAPDDDLLQLLAALAAKKNISVVIISGRDRIILEKWFSHLPLGLVAEHGIFLKEKNMTWRLLKPVRKNWKKKIHPVLKNFTEKLPGSFIEEKEFSLVFHYRKSDPAFASLRVKELINQLISFTSNMDIQLVTGSKVLEIRNSGIDKGVAALHWLNSAKVDSDRILAIGNDVTDEDLFRSLPSEALTFTVGLHPSYARYHVNSTKEVRSLLEKLL